MASRRFWLLGVLLSILLLVAAVGAAAPRKRLALVIGNGRYASAPLANAVNDATDVALTLKDLGFEVILERNADAQTMERAVEAFKRGLHDSHVGLFYFAGHGLQLDGENYLVPVDAEINSESDARYRTLPADWVLGKMEDAGNPVSIVVLDACRNNPFTRGFRFQYQGLAQMRSPKGSIITYATAPGKVAADGEGRNGLYTKHLLRHMVTRGIKVEEVFKRVREDVWSESGQKQLPWTSTSIIGEFSFTGGMDGNQTGPASLGGASFNGQTDSSLAAKRERLEREKRELETLKARVEANRHRAEEERRRAEERARIEADFQRVAQEKEALLAMARRPLPPAASGKKTTNSLGMVFVYIGPGSFEMGSAPDESGRSDDEGRHRVTLTRGYYLQTTEVTQGQWQAVMGKNPSTFSGCGDHCPVENVSWNDAQDFIRKLNARGKETYRLPTEAEWEYAARAGASGRFCFGDDDGELERYGWYEDNSDGRTHPVAMKQPNAWGLYDMHGNVWEWCQDAKGDYPSGVVNDPKGPSSGSSRVIRGGGWGFPAQRCRSAIRFGFTQSCRSGGLGFRLAMTPVR